MKKNIEIEIRGPLSKGQFLHLHKFLDKNGKVIRKKSRLSLIYFRNRIPKNVVDDKNELVDLRLRVTNNKAAIVMKYGKWGGSDNRWEFEIPIDRSQFGGAINFLKALGWIIAVANTTDSIDYLYKGIIFSVVDIKNVGYVYEAEILAKQGENIRVIKRKIQKICLDLGLKEYKRGEFEKQCNKINNIKKLQFNFADVPFGVLRKRFGRFLD